MLALALLFAAAAPHIHSSLTLTNADGTRLELTTTFHAAARDGETLNTAIIEIVTGAGRLFVEGRAVTSPGEIDPCWMPAMFLLAKGYVTERQVFDALGFNGQWTARGDVVQTPLSDRAIATSLYAQVLAMRPDRAARVLQLLTDAGVPPGPCTEPR